jgi:hypothetical protein
MRDRKIKNGPGLLHFSVSHFSVWSVSVAEKVAEAQGARRQPTIAAPEDVLLVSENGLRTGKHLRGLRAIGYKGFLTENFNPVNMII